MTLRDSFFGFSKMILLLPAAARPPAIFISPRARADKTDETDRTNKTNKVPKVYCDPKDLNYIWRSS